MLNRSPLGAGWQTAAIMAIRCGRPTTHSSAGSLWVIPNAAVMRLFVQHADSRKTAWNRAMSVLLPNVRNRWRQCQPPRRASKKRRVRRRPPPPPLSIINVRPGFRPTISKAILAEDVMRLADTDNHRGPR